jgi:hypothetical protein
MENKIVANQSKAYGYNYASLSDIVNQGFEIPKMKTGTEDGKEYVYYLDKELNEWIRGAEIVIPENIVNANGKNKMNKTQLYGSALTYARRYTCHLALQLACDDDKKVETEAPKKSGIFDMSLADEFRALYSQEDQARILKGLNIKTAEEIGEADLQKYIIFKKNEKQTDKGERNQPTN